jgi:hypothetical protein
MCTNEPLIAIKDGWKKFERISWKFAEIRRGQPPPLVIRGLKQMCEILVTAIKIQQELYFEQRLS